MAIRAALLNQEYEIGFGGEGNMEFVDDVSKCFIACALKAPGGAPSYNMLGDILTVEEMIHIIEEMIPSSKGKITCVKQVNKMANRVSDSGLQALIGPFRPVTYREGAGLTADFFRRLLKEGRLS